MSANTETTGAPEGHGRCYRCATAFHKKTQAMCWRCWDAMIPGTCIGDVRRTVGPDWTPPIAAPAAHVERRKGQVWRFIGCGMSEELTLARLVTAPRERWEDTNGQAWWFGPEDMHEFVLLADATPEPAKPLMLGDLAKDPGLLERLRTSPPVQEAPKAAPVCHGGCGGMGLLHKGDVLERVIKGRGRILACDGYMLFMGNDGAPIVGTGVLRDPAIAERLPRPQLAADWVEDCLEDA